MSESDTSFIGESGGEPRDHNPLALSSCSDVEDSSFDDDDDDDDDHDDDGLQTRAVTLSDAQELLAFADALITDFDAIASTVRGHRYLPIAVPTQAGPFRVAGLARLRSKLHAERRHIATSLESGSYSQLRGNNIAALGVAIAVLATEPDVSAVMYHAGYGAGRDRRTVELDLITDGGQRWVKVKASSRANFMREVGIGPHAETWEEGDTLPPFLETLRCLTKAAEEPAFRLPFGRRPHVVVACAEEPPVAVRLAIQQLDPSIRVQSVGLTTNGGRKLCRRSGPLLNMGHAGLTGASGYPIRVVNFDVNTMVALVCDCCHGYAGHSFPQHHVLNQQSQDESKGIRAIEDFIKPVLLEHTVWGSPPEGADMEGSSALGSEAAAERWPLNWIAAEVALSEFRWILETIAGPDELARSRWLLARITPKADAARSAAVDQLRPSKHIQDRHKAVFGVGDHEQAISLTGNRTFVQAAQEQGVALLVALHPSRALTERKRRGMQLHPKSDPPLS